MEVTCSRCHQAVPVDSCFCPTCGLPQLVYAAEGESAPPPLPDAPRDASSINWKPGMRAALTLALPAGFLSAGVSPLSTLGILWMAGAAAWAVGLYMRGQRSAWITMGAGARIGLVTGLIAAWLAFGVTAAGLFTTRVVLHQGAQLDTTWRETVDKTGEMSQQLLTKMGASTEQIQASLAQRNMMLSPEGRAGYQTMGLVWNCLWLVLFAVAGGALGARTMGKSRRPGV